MLRRLPPRQVGFTLIEVLVAVTITSILLVALLRLFSGGLVGAESTSAYDDAIVIAESTLEATSVNVRLRDGAVIDRDEGRFHVVASIHRYGLVGKDQAGPIIPYEVAVTVSWQDRRQPRGVTLRSLRLGARQ